MSYTPNQISETSAIGVNSDTVISGGNWVDGDNYVGLWELNDYAYVGVNLQIDEVGTLFFDFSQDNGASFSSYPVAGFNVSSGINEVHTAWKGGRYFRIRFVRSSGTRTYFKLKTFYSNHSLPLSAPLNQSIGEDQDATVVRSVTIGQNPTDSYVNQKTDGQGFFTTTPLAIAGQYDSGVLDLQGYTQVQTHISSDVDGTITVEFCSDSGGTVTRTLVIPYSASSGFQMFSAPAFTPYVRYIYDNGGTIQASFFFDTKFLTKSLSGQLLGMDAFIAPSMTANLGRNVIVGQDNTGTFRNVPTDTEGHLKVNINDPLTAFGDLRTAELTPQIQLTFPYGINSDLVDTTLVGAGTVTQSNSMAVLNTTAAASSSATLSSRNVVNYRSGLGTLARFTAMFTTGVASSHQIIGIGDAEDGFFIGYNGTEFGILIRRGGVDTWTPQTSWNVDKMDGNNGSSNPSNMLLDKTKINVFEISFQWLGAGEIKFYIENPETGGFVPVHRVKYANSFVIPSIYNPNLTLSAEVSNDTNTSDIQLNTASMAGFTEGKNVVTGPVNAVGGTHSSAVENHFFHLRNKGTYVTLTNKIRCILKSLSAGNDTNGISEFTIYRNATLLGTPSWTDINGDDSVMEVDTVQTYDSGGKVLFKGIVGKDNGANFDLEDLGIKVIPNDVITVTSDTLGGANPQRATLIWQEDF